jgi:hypothetical protein
LGPCGFLFCFFYGFQKPLPIASGRIDILQPIPRFAKNRVIGHYGVVGDSNHFANRSIHGLLPHLFPSPPGHYDTRMPDQFRPVNALMRLSSTCVGTIRESVALGSNFIFMLKG